MTEIELVIRDVLYNTSIDHIVTTTQADRLCEEIVAALREKGLV